MFLSPKTVMTPPWVEKLPASDDVPSELRGDLELVLVDTGDEVLTRALESPAERRSVMTSTQPATDAAASAPPIQARQGRGSTGSHRTEPGHPF